MVVDLHTALTFSAVVLGLFLIPGPAVLLTLSRAVSGGRVVGLATGWGISLGDLCHALFAVLGLSAILMTSALAFQVVKFVGVAYLIFLGVKALYGTGLYSAHPRKAPECASRRPAPYFLLLALLGKTVWMPKLFFKAVLLEKSDVPHLPSAAQVSVWQAFRQGVMTELLNPKTALFFLAFLPQFLRPAHGAVTAQLLILGLIFVLMSAIYTALIALAGGAARRPLERFPAVGRVSGKVIGMVYLLLGARLAFERH